MEPRVTSVYDCIAAEAVGLYLTVHDTRNLSFRTFVLQRDMITPKPTNVTMLWVVRVHVVHIFGRT